MWLIPLLILNLILPVGISREAQMPTILQRSSEIRQASKLETRLANFAQSNQATFLDLRVSRFQESKKEIKGEINVVTKISNKQ